MSMSEEKQIAKIREGIDIMEAHHQLHPVREEVVADYKFLLSILDRQEEEIKRMRDGLEQAYRESLYKPARYHHLCYGGSTVERLDRWSSDEFMICPYAGDDDWMCKACKNCDGKHKADMDLTEYEQLGNYGMERLYKKITAILRANKASESLDGRKP